MIATKEVSAYLEFALVADSCICMASFFDRSLAGVRSISASLADGGIRAGGTKLHKPLWGFQSYVQPIVLGKDRFYHCIAFSGAFGKELFLTTGGSREKDFHHYLMHNYDYPILKQWSAAIFAEAVKCRYICRLYPRLIRGKYCSGDEAAAYGKYTDLNVIELYRIKLPEDALEKLISGLLEKKTICISEKEQRPLVFRDMNQYFEKYGKTLVSNLECQLEPLVPLDGNCRHLALNKMRLMPPQAAQVNGLVELLKKSKYAVLNMGMGTGKTITSISAVEGFFNIRNGGTLKEIYSDPTAIKYRNVVMCPGHLVEKWAKEIREQVPGAEVTILNSFSQLTELEKAGKEREKREWYIIGKDFAKLGYQSIPVPKRSGYRKIYVRKCEKCGRISRDFRGTPFSCKSCGNTGFQIFHMEGEEMEGMICPFCNHLLLENKNCEAAGEESELRALTGLSFTAQSSRNIRCHICGEYLWKPHVANLVLPGEKQKATPWYQVTHYANKTHRTKKTVWLHEAYAENYFHAIGEKPLSEKRDRGIRKYPPASYVKKKLKGYFDFLILDEAHLYKGGTTAQGNAMHAFIRSSKKVLALTGTIAGGMAGDLFYLLYRLDPERMKQHGYGFHNEMKFTEKYGSMESVYEVDIEKGEYNKTSRGRQIQGAKPKPGISPLVFGEFLLDKAVFLDLTDMSDMLPPYREFVELVEVPGREPEGRSCTEVTEYDAQFAYRQILQSLKEKSRNSLGNAILGTMLQFALSYPDKPYGVPDMIHPCDGSILETIPNYEVLVEDGKLLAKEERLISILNRELAEQRNCVIYAEYTGSPSTCITHRLKEILVENTELSEDEVEILEASSPAAVKREAWLHKKAEEGVRVFITNPRCVETGLDFIWEKDGIIYNFPTLIFYQMGYSLFTVWQASRRAYRLIQKEECRTYYLAYAGTLQQMVIQLIAEKRVATAAIQGKFSAEGISAMANGVDARVRLAQALSGMELEHKELQDMFREYPESRKTDGYGKVSRMPLVSEITGSVAIQCQQEKNGRIPADIMEQDYFLFLHSMDDMFRMFQETDSETVAEGDILSEEFLQTEEDYEKSCEKPQGRKQKSADGNLSRREKKARNMGQLSLFGFPGIEE